MSTTAIKADRIAESARTLRLLRALGNEDQRIAFAVLEGMRLQKDLGGQCENAVRDQGE